VDGRERRHGSLVQKYVRRGASRTRTVASGPSVSSAAFFIDIVTGSFASPATISTTSVSAVDIGS